MAGRLAEQRPEEYFGQSGEVPGRAVRYMDGNRLTTDWYEPAAAQRAGESECPGAGTAAGPRDQCTPLRRMEASSARRSLSN